MKIEFTQLSYTDRSLMDLIAGWYNEEWQIADDVTRSSLLEFPSQKVIFQCVMWLNGEPVGTGGLYLKVGIQEKIEKYVAYQPWVALMYTKTEIRGKGLGAKLLAEIESQAFRMGIERIYLFTHTAEQLYSRNNWNVIERFDVMGRKIAVMEKSTTAPKSISYLSGSMPSSILPK
jgi:GNAT superfamily N-acetyltransferase